MNSQTKLCPFCDNEIKLKAKKCQYCNEWLTDAPSPSGSLTGIDLVRQALGDRYEVLHELGRGGMATVYKANQKSLGRTVALKVIHQNLVHDEQFVKRFHREAQISASLQHPNIVTIYDVGEVQGVHYMAMEYLEGTDLHQMISKSGRLGEQQSLSYVLSVARALEYVHKRELIHRDIKSSNIFICSDAEASQADQDANTGQRPGARVVLMDFGIAHAASGTRLTRTGAVIGSPEYMSPEQAEAKPVDHRTDIYSLGVVLYECLTGRVPFKTDSYISTIRKVIDEPPDANMLNHVDTDLRQFTLRLMTKQAAFRPANARSVADAIKLLQQGKQWQSSGTSPSEEEACIKTNEFHFYNITINQNNIVKMIAFIWALVFCMILCPMLFMSFFGLIESLYMFTLPVGFMISTIISGYIYRRVYH